MLETEKKLNALNNERDRVCSEKKKKERKKNRIERNGTKSITITISSQCLLLL